MSVMYSPLPPYLPPDPDPQMSVYMRASYLCVPSRSLHRRPGGSWYPSDGGMASSPQKQPKNKLHVDSLNKYLIFIIVFLNVVVVIRVSNETGNKNCYWTTNIY